MTIEDVVSPMNHGSARFGGPRWTLADFLSSYRYWALFLSSLLMAFGGHGTGIVMPLMLTQAGSSYESIGVYHLGINAGSVLGAFIAFVVAPRRARSALIWPIVVCVVVTIVFLLIPELWSSPLVLIILGLACGAAQGAFPLALAVILAGGHPGRIDFAGALLLLSSPILATFLAPMGAAQLYQAAGGWAVLAGLVICLLLAATVLLLARDLGFTDEPPARHRPRQPFRRSPIMVAAFLLALPLLSLLLVLVSNLASSSDTETGEFNPVVLALAFATSCIALAALFYLGVWIYRIHGELAGAARSQRLLTPFAAVLITFLVPLGLPVLLLTLGDLLNDRARAKGHGRALSIGWLAVWTLLLPPIAIAMIQNAANGSYGAIRDAA